MADDTIDKVWYPASEEDYPFHWRVGEVVKTNVEKGTIEVEVGQGREISTGGLSDEDDAGEHTGETLVIPVKHTRHFVERHLDDWNDILSMGDLHDASLLELLRRRYRNSKMYTYAGPVLMLINPYEMVDTCSVDAPPEVGTPHLFDLAQRVVTTMENAGPKGTSQSVLVNGESGAGKTEACKTIVRYLAHQSRQRKKELKAKENEVMSGYVKGLGVGSSRPNPVLARRGRGRGRQMIGGRGIQLGTVNPAQEQPRMELEEDSIEERGSVETLIISTNPLLEAFGNAVTICNSNSSRFGKFVQLLYDKKNGPISGASTLHFLLEKSRIIHHGKGERNYHIFYQLLAASEAGVLKRELDEAELAQGGLDSPKPTHAAESISIPCDSSVTSVSLASTADSLESNQSKTHKSRKKGLLPSTNAYDYKMLIPSIGKDFHAVIATEEQEISATAVLEKQLGEVVLASDLENFRSTVLALNVVGVSKSDQALLWKTLAGLLVLSNVVVKKSSESKSQNVDACRVSKKSRKTLKHACNLLGVNPDQFQNTLCVRTLVVGKKVNDAEESYQTTEVPLSVGQAMESLEALIKTIYTSIFDWLIDRVNTASNPQSNGFGSRQRKQLFVGILDIFGFEVLETNSFEQLCINYANEVLQQLFDQSVFEWEMDEYRTEEVDCEVLTYQDNSALIRVFDDPLGGLFPLLNQQCVIGSGDRSGSDASFFAKINQFYSQPENRSEHFSISKLGSSPLRPKPFQVSHGHYVDRVKRSGSVTAASFVVHHFISDVVYDTRGFVAKNIDALQRDLLGLFGHENGNTCTNTLLAEIVTTFAIKASVDQGIKRPGSQPPSPRSSLTTPTAKKSSKMKMAQLQTVGSKFLEQLSALKQLLQSTGLNFVRCIRPNDEKAPKCWQPDLVLNQLVFLGVMNLVRIRNEGFPVRRAFGEVLKRFPELTSEESTKWKPGVNDEVACKELLTHALRNTPLEGKWQAGTTKCFLKNEVLDRLNHVVREKRNAGAARLQYLARRRKARSLLRAQREAAVVLESFARMVPLRLNFVRNRASRKITTFLRRAPLRVRFLKIRAAVVCLQARARGRPVAEQMKELKHATIVIQRFAQRFLLRLAVQEYVRVEQEWNKVSAAIKVQSFARMVVVNLQVLRAKYYLFRFQCVWRSYIVRKQYRRIMTKREPWRELLRPNEAVLHTSTVMKTTEKKKNTFFKVVSKKKRQLIMTTGTRPRLFYVEPTSKQLKGEIVWHPTKTSCVVSGETNFVVQSIPSLEKGKTNWHFTDLSGNPLKWMRAIREPATALDLVESRCQLDAESDGGSNLVLKQGSVMVLEYGTKRTWKRRWMQVQGVEIQFSSSEYDPSPLSCITVDNRVTVSPTEGDPSSLDVSRTFHITAPLYPLGLKVRCHTADERGEWLEVLSLVLESEHLRDDTLVHQKKKAASLMTRYDDLISQKNQEIEQLREALNKYRSREKGASSVRSQRNSIQGAPTSEKRRSLVKADW